MSAVQTSLSLQQSGSLLDKAKSKLHDVVETVKQTGNDINDSVVKPLKEAYDNVKESVDILKEGADALSDMATSLAKDHSLESAAKATEKFDGDWDKFAADFDKKYRSVVEAGNDNVLETMVRQTMGDKVFEAGSIIKNEAPQLFVGINDIKSSLNTIIHGEGDIIERAKQIKDSTEKIIGAVKQVDASLNNVFNRATTQLGVNANALIGLQKKLHSLADTVSGNVPEGIKTSISRLGDGIEVLYSGRSMVVALLADADGEMTAEKLAKLTKDLGDNWDDFAPKVNALYAKLSGNDQANILETLAKSKFGENVFNAGGAIKKELPGILTGIADFKKSLGLLKGNNNTIASASNIRNGVEGIVKATEKLAQSVNNAIKLYKGHGKTDGVKGLPLLDKLSNIGDARVVKTLTNVAALGSGAVIAVSDAAAIRNSLKSGNYTKAWSDLKKAFNDVKQIAKDVKHVMKGERTDGGKNSSKKQEKQDEQKDKDEKDTTKASTDSYVCNGATMKCTFGTTPAMLSVYPDRRVFLTGQPMANISDHQSLYNIHRFGLCRTTSFPSTGSATAANHGTLTPMPCLPGTQTNWMNGKGDYIVKGYPALLKSSYCKCQWGGIITITNDGQKDTGKPDGSKENRETFLGEK